jgi:metal-sulfur cluster biosynthetic enzyme
MTTEREAEVLDRLGRVTDPELDEPVTQLRFISGISVDAAGGVSIGFRLPTFWCAANFAFLMADDMRREVAALPWVRRVEVRLGEHMYADKINDGLRRGASFQETFGADAAEGLDSLRRTFLVKAFQRRQEALLRHLLESGVAPTSVVAMSLAALAEWPLDEPGGVLRQRYLERRYVCAGDTEWRAFVAADGAAIDAESLPAYLRALARVGVNVEFNGAICRGLLAARFDEAPPEPATELGRELGREPGLADFVRAAARAQARPERVS